MEIELEMLTDAVELGQLALVSEVLVVIGRAVLAGEVITVSSRLSVGQPLCLTTFSAYQDWLSQYFPAVLRA